MKATLYRNIVILVYVLLLPLAGFAQRDGDLDPTFNFGMDSINYIQNGTNGAIYISALQPDGKIIIGGTFTLFKGISINKIARLNVDGSLDTSFNPETGTSGEVRFVTLQPDGKIIIGGSFTAYNNSTRVRIARLNPNGRLDTSFNSRSEISGVPYSVINSIVKQEDGKIIIGGDFRFFNGIARNRIARLNIDGSLDSTFNSGAGANDIVGSIALQPNGKIIIGGNFSTYNGVGRNRIVRLNVDGSLDSDFNIGTGPDGGISSISLQTDGKIIIVGGFNSYNSIRRVKIARLHNDGLLDLSFDANFNTNGGFDNFLITSTAIQSDGRIIIGRAFSNGTNLSCILTRLSLVGSIDNSFDQGIAVGQGVYSINFQIDGKILLLGSFTTYNNKIRNNIACISNNGPLDHSIFYTLGPNESVLSSSLQYDGKIIIGGSFTSFNGTSINRIARLNTNGSLDNSFNPGTGANAEIWYIKVLNSGKIIIAGKFTLVNGYSRNRIARLNNDGSLDTTFNPGTGANETIWYAAIQSDEKIIVGGDFTIFNGLQKNRLVRLHSNGDLDTSFNIGSGPSSSVTCLSLLPNGKVIIGGRFTSFNRLSRNRLARLNINGSLDTSFIPMTNANHNIWTLALQSDGKIIYGGQFNKNTDNSSAFSNSRNGLARLNTNGSFDTSFNRSGDGFTSGSNSIIYSLVQPDGRIIISGIFSIYNGVTCPGLIRLNIDGSVDRSFNTTSNYSGGVTSILKLNDGKLIITGYFTRFRNSNIQYINRIYGYSCPSLSTPLITSSGQTNICHSDSLTLTASNGSRYLWNTGDTTRSITVNQAGTYTVRSMNNVCTSSISNPITVNVIAPPAPQIAFDSVGNRCLGSEIIVSITGNHNQFRWNTGATTRSINVRRTGEYSAEVLDSSGCWSLPSRPSRIVFDTAFCIIRISIIGLDSLEASIYADRYEWFLDGIQLLAGNNGKVIPIQGNGVYTVRAIIDGRTSPMSEPIVITSGKKSINAPKLKLYPNPTTGIVTLTTSPDAESIAITNAVGQLVFTTKAQPEMELNLSHLAKGVYMVQVQSNKGVTTQRLVIQ